MMMILNIVVNIVLIRYDYYLHFYIDYTKFLKIDQLGHLIGLKLTAQCLRDMANQEAPSCV